ncbi:Solute carrier family 22 member 18 [Bos mutus]|uniref:Organic cation transporter-like protein 2 n=1 Tax=Bos mutus TaxID=72004 RepID=L8I0L3_9CETA|nr:Solute carrier family 22 member 18 [Bos mutus]
MRKVGAPGGQGQAPSGMGALGRSGVVLLTYVLAALELTCLFMQFSIMPYLSRRLGLDSVAFGYQQTVFGVLQLLGGPVFGRFADQHGARAAFTLSFLASSALYLLLAAACIRALPGVALLFASRLPGALMHTLPAAQMVIADLSTPEERPAALGRLGLCFGVGRVGLCFGVGLIFGSLLGGTLSSSCGIQCPVIVAFVVTLLGALLSVTCIPASTKGASAHAQTTLPGRPKASVFDLKAITRLLLQPGVLPVPLVPRRANCHGGLFMVMFSIISMDFFQLEAAQAGYLMSFFGVLQMVIQGLVIGRLSSHFSEGDLLRASVLVFSVVGLAMALMANVFHFCLLMPGLVFSMCALNVVTDSMLTKAVSTSDTGTMLGLCASVQPLTRTLGPTLGGLLYRGFGVPVFGHVQFAVNFIVFLVLWRQPVPRKMGKAQ